MATARATTPRTRPDQVFMTTPQMIFLGLLVLSICINYIDRGSLGIAGPMLTKELNLDPEQFGMLLSAFFWTYAILQIPAGWLVDRYNVNWVYGLGFAIWSGATLFTGLSHGLVLLFVSRLLLGIGESVAYPSYSKILSSHFKEHQRGLANGLIDAGSKAGPALGVLFGAGVMGAYGWRSFFVVVGGASLLWILPWAIWAPKPDPSRPFDHANAPTQAMILSKRSAWGSFLQLLCSNYTWYFIALWMPSYFQKVLHYSPQETARFGQIPFWAIAVGTTLAGWLSDRLIAEGFSPTLIRKSVGTVGLVLCALTLTPAAMSSDRTTTMILLSAAGFFFGGMSANVWAITQTLAGPSAAGKWTGIQNFVGNVPGMVGPWFTGWLIKQYNGDYLPAFYVASGFAILSALSLLFIVEKVEPIDWSK